MDQLEGKRIDPRIRNILVVLNQMGFETISSCAGHKTKNGIEDGYITFRNELDIEVLTKQLKLLGIENLEIELGTSWASVPSTTVRFPGLGGTKGYKKRIQTEKLNLEDKEIGKLFLLFSRNLSRCGIHHLSRTATLARYSLIETLEGHEIPKQDKDG